MFVMKSETEVSHQNLDQYKVELRPCSESADKIRQLHIGSWNHRKSPQGSLTQVKPLADLGR